MRTWSVSHHRIPPAAVEGKRLDVDELVEAPRRAEVLALLIGLDHAVRFGVDLLDIAGDGMIPDVDLDLPADR